MMQNLYLHLHELCTKVCFCGHSAGKHTFHKTRSIVIYVIHCNHHPKERIITRIKDALICWWVDAVFSSLNQQRITVANLTVQLFTNLEGWDTVQLSILQNNMTKYHVFFPIISCIYNIMPRLSFFYVLLTMHPGIIFVNKPTWCTVFLIYLFLFSTCFGQLHAHHQENQLYQCDTWYMSLCVDDHLVCRSFWPAYQMVIYTEWHIPGVASIQLILLMMGTQLPETCRE